MPATSPDDLSGAGSQSWRAPGGSAVFQTIKLELKLKRPKQLKEERTNFFKFLFDTGVVV
jgi:hypothetical protein